MDALELPTTAKTLSSIQINGYFGKIIIKSQLTTFAPGYCYGSSIHGSTHYTFVIDVNAVIPLSGSNYNMHYYYVRDDLVESYKEASNWSTIKSRILPMSALPS